MGLGFLRRVEKFYHFLQKKISQNFYNDFQKSFHKKTAYIFVYLYTAMVSFCFTPKSLWGEYLTYIFDH